jgi:WD40 repeat protein
MLVSIGTMSGREVLSATLPPHTPVPMLKRHVALCISRPPLHFSLLYNGQRLPAAETLGNTIGPNQAWITLVVAPRKIVLTGSKPGFPRGAHLWDAETGEQVQTFAQMETVIDASVSLDGAMVITGMGNGDAKIWDVQTADCLQILIGHKGGVNSAQFSPDSTMALTASGDCSALLWDIHSGLCMRQLKGPESASSAIFSFDGSKILIVRRGHSATVYSTHPMLYSTHPMLSIPRHADGLRQAAFTPDAKAVVTASLFIKLWDVDTGLCMKTFETAHSSPILSISFSGDGAYLRTGSLDGTVKVWCRWLRNCVQTALDLEDDDDEEFYATAFSSDGESFLTATLSHVNLWSTRDGTCQQQLEARDFAKFYPGS